MQHFDPKTTTDKEIIDTFKQLKKLHKKYELLPMYHDAMGGKLHSVHGMHKDGMIRSIMQYLVDDIGEFDVDALTMAVTTVTITRFPECPEPISTISVEEKRDELRQQLIGDGYPETIAEHMVTGLTDDDLTQLMDISTAKKETS